MRGKVSDRAPIIAGIISGMSAKAVAVECGCSLQMVYKVAGEIGYEWPERESALTGKEDQIRDMIVGGMTKKQIASELGIGFSCLKRYMRKKEIRSDLQEMTQERIEKNIRKYGNAVQYAGGYTDCRSRITVRCDVCGGEFDIAYQWIIAHKVNCPICKAAERAAEKEEKNRRLAHRRCNSLKADKVSPRHI